MNLATAPSFLCIGTPLAALEFAELELRKLWCDHTRAGETGCFCKTCRQLQQQCHPNVIWLSSPDGYTNQDLEIVFEKSRFLLEKNEQFFFIIGDAEKLGAHAANRLLKLIEEPPHGYHFIFLANNKSFVLPTIISRAQIHVLQNTELSNRHPLLEYFLAGTYDPLDFEALLKSSNPSDHDALAIAESLLQATIQEIIGLARIEKDSLHLSSRCAIIQNSLDFPPQSGSAGIFLRNLLLQLDANN